MAANYLTIGSRFQPFSYAELVAPVQAYQNEYDRQEELYNQYAEAAGLIGAELNSELDRDVLEKTYNPYMQALNEAAATLSSEGLTPGGRAALQSLRRQFGREITPIKLAAEARAKARENWDKMYAADRTLMTNANPYYQGVSAYMNGASPETFYVSGDELYSRGQAVTKALSETLRDVPESERLALQGQYWRIVKQKGFFSKEMQDFISGVAGANPELDAQIQRIMEASGVLNNGFSDADIQRAEQYIREGMISGMSGSTDVDYLKTDFPESETSSESTLTPGMDKAAIIPVGQAEAPGKLNRRVTRNMDQMGQTGMGVKSIKYKGEDIALPDDLWTQVYLHNKYGDNMEKAAEEHERLREEYIREQENIPEIQTKIYEEEAASTMYGGAPFSVTRNKIKEDAERLYPKPMRAGALDRKIRKFKKEVSEWTGNYDISADPAENMRIATALTSQELNYQTYFYNTSGNDTDIDKLISSIGRNPSQLYKYNASTGTYEESPSGRYTGNANYKITGVNIDQHGNIVVAIEGEKTPYVYLGTLDDMLKTATFRAYREAPRMFRKEDEPITLSGGKQLVIPGTGTRDKMKEVNPEEVSTERIGTVVQDFDQLIKDKVFRPVKYNNVEDVAYISTVKSNGNVYRILASPDGTIMDIVDAETAASGGTPYESELLAIFAQNILNDKVYDALKKYAKGE